MHFVLKTMRMRVCSSSMLYRDPLLYFYVVEMLTKNDFLLLFKLFLGFILRWAPGSDILDAQNSRPLQSRPSSHKHWRPAAVCATRACSATVTPPPLMGMARVGGISDRLYRCILKGSKECWLRLNTAL